MKITALLVLRTNTSTEEEDPVILANASDVSVYQSIFSVSRTVAKSTPPAQRQSVQHSEYKVHAYSRGDLCALGFMDDDYPVSSAFSLLEQVLDEYHKNFGETWRTINVDNAQPWPYLDDALSTYQDPAEADKLGEAMIKTIESVLARGEIHILLSPSQSQAFFRQPKKTNQRCTIL